MIKILVIDSGWGALEIGNYIEQELPVEVKKIIGKQYTDPEIVDAKIRQYLGKVDAIVLCDQVLTASFGPYFEGKYPGQKFVMYGWDLPEVIARLKRVMILTPKKLRATKYYQMVKARCQDQEITELDYDKWLKMSKDGSFESLEVINKEIENFVGEKIIINSSELLGIEEHLKEVVGWRAEITDLREGVVSALKVFLGLDKHASRGRVGSADCERMDNVSQSHANSQNCTNRQNHTNSRSRIGGRNHKRAKAPHATTLHGIL